MMIMQTYPKLCLDRLFSYLLQIKILSDRCKALGTSGEWPASRESRNTGYEHGDGRHATRTSMNVKLNGKPEQVDQTTVLELLRARNIEPQMVSVEHNLKILDKDHFATTPLHEGDSIEFLYYMGGGG